MGQNIIDQGKISWQSPSNIALIKYWGKRGNQLPCNPSLSMTLNASSTTTTLLYKRKVKPSDKIDLSFYFDGNRSEDFESRVTKYLNQIIADFPLLTGYELIIESSNTFPHSSGIASSASAFSALALCIMSLKNIVTKEVCEDDFLKQASQMARMGSGSAARSIYGNFTIWGNVRGYDLYSDLYATPLQSETHPIFQSYKDAILIVSREKKKVGSSAGHALMNNNPYAKVRYSQAMDHTTEMIDVLKSGNVKRFIEIVELEALTLHGLMMSSDPGYILMQKETIEIIDRIQHFRKSKQIPVSFTLDAGPNMHVLYPESYKTEVLKLINDELLQFCVNKHWINDGIGGGPKMING